MTIETFAFAGIVYVLLVAPFILFLTLMHAALTKNRQPRTGHFVVVNAHLLLAAFTLLACLVVLAQPT